MDSEIFDDYYDAEGNLHIDARKKVHQRVPVVNKVFRVSGQDRSSSQPKKLIIHHCNMVD